HAVHPHDEAAGRKPAEMIVALDQCDVRARLRSRPRRRAPRRPATDHDHITAVVDVYFANVLTDLPAASGRWQVAARAFEHVRSEEAFLAVPENPLHLHVVGHGPSANASQRRRQANGRCAPRPHSLGARVPARWRSGYAEDCKSLHAGSIPARASTFPLASTALRLLALTGGRSRP